MTTPPYTTQDQFIVMAVTGTVGGKKVKMTVSNVYAAAKMLTERPHRPRFHGPKLILSFLIRLRMSSIIGMT